MGKRSSRRRLFIGRTIMFVNPPMQWSNRVVLLGKAMNRRGETLSNENINNDKCETDFLHLGANEMNDGDFDLRDRIIVHKFSRRSS